ncbi:uncharacterized protein PAC_07740 [Phialocephala subalpina]|uniref:Uncharacterized protein n=1 Tax=Phialocephala subalpina TaxID=576137 RepID=A0A1L7WYL2_9HELO|nr:uncharacterized protein PAC_07740 [Phialocephala subalpina]
MESNNTSSNSNATLLGGYNFGFYENSTQLTGNHFKDPVLVSAIVVNGICVFSFAALAIVSCWMKSKRTQGRKVFAVLYGLVVAMFLAYARTMADEIVHELGLDMITAYLALPIVKQVLANGTDATLIYVVYCVIKNRFRCIRPKKDRYVQAQHIHMGIFVLMLLFAVADAGLYSYTQVYTVSNDAEDSKAINISNWYRNIHLSYITIYCAVILEMFTCAVFIFQQSSPNQIRISKFLIFIVTPFLVIRSISNLALTLIYVYLAHYEQKSTGVIIAVLLGLTSVAVYTGLVIIGLENEKDWDDGINSAAMTEPMTRPIFDVTGRLTPCSLS